MNGGIKFLADTNALLYMFKANSCMQPYLKEKLGISFISEIELFSFKKMTKQEEQLIESLIDAYQLFGIDKEIKRQTIKLRRDYGTKLPDAIIAATAIVNNLTLLTADKGFNKITELNMVLLEP